MRVAVEMSHLASSAADRGMGRYVRAIASAQLLLDDIELVEFSVPLRESRFGELASMPSRARALRAARADVDHTPSPYLLGQRHSVPRVVSILDLIPILVTCHQRTGIKARLVHRWAARADVVLTLSEFSKTQIEAHLGVAPERIVVAPLPPSLEETGGGRRPDVPLPYALAVADCATPDPRKRLDWLEPVAGALADSGGVLVVVGRETKERFGEARGVSALGPVSDPVLHELMVGARLLAFPSAYEGQGLPPLEAMSCGTPVVAMSNSSLPEIVGAGGVLVDEETPDWARNACLGSEHVHARSRFVDACAGLFDDTDRRVALGGDAARQARSFDERRFAVGLRTAYELALGRSAGD